jgi:pyruvate dehydrogenase complex dehydrogenase (E1) component
VNDDQSTYKKLDANYWKEKYFQLMEEHLALIKKTQENKNNE